MKNAGRGLQHFSCFQCFKLYVSRMKRCSTLCITVLLVYSLTVVVCLPSSLVEEIKTNEFRENKVKRAHPPVNGEEDNVAIPYYSKPTAIKRGTNAKNTNQQQQNLNEWEREQERTALFQNQNNLANMQSGLFNNGDNFDDKTIAEYEKGFQYGINKDKLDEALENAVLKSELYGDPSAINQYRYYGNDDRRRKRRDVRKLRLSQRMKREVDLTPEEILTLLSLYENNHQQGGGENFRSPWYRFEQNQDVDEDDGVGQDEENWLSNPVYPHANSRNAEIGPNYMFEDAADKHGKWGGFSDDRKKRFMVAKKRNNDPTRELRYLNGPNKNDFYTLSQLLSNQREPNVPFYHRLVL